MRKYLGSNFQDGSLRVMNWNYELSKELRPNWKLDCNLTDCTPRIWIRLVNKKTWIDEFESWILS